LKQRRYDIDWLRITAMLILFSFHNARFFDFMDWHLKNAERSMGFMAFVGFLHQWLMPIFFLVSGAGSWFALEFRDSGQYLRDRFKRLLVPYYLVGLLILVPPQYYWEQVTHGRFIGSFSQFIPHYFHYPRDPQIFGFYLKPGPLFLSYWSGHLWFLHYLFLFSLIALPLFLFLKSNSGKNLISGLAGLCHRRGGIFLFVIPVALIQMALRARFPIYLWWADFGYWLVFFIIGYLLPADERFKEAIERTGWISLAIGATTTFVILLGFATGYTVGWEQNPTYTPGYLIYQALRSLNTWCWIAFALAISSNFLNFRNKILDYCSEAVLPFYVLHQTIILAVGYYVVQWNLNILLKYLIISTTSFAVIMTLYDLLIRRNIALRFLFGMRVKAQAAKIMAARR